MDTFCTIDPSGLLLMLSVSKSSLGVTARGRAKPLAICGTRGGSEVVVSVVPATLHHLLAALLFPKRVNLRYPAILHINGSAIALLCNRPPNSAVSRKIAIPRYRRRRSGPLHASPHRRMCSLVGVNWREERTVVFGSLSDPAEHQVVVVVLLRLLASDGFPPSRPHSRNNGTSLNSKKRRFFRQREGVCKKQSTGYKEQVLSYRSKNVGNEDVLHLPLHGHSLRYTSLPTPRRTKQRHGNHAHEHGDPPIRPPRKSLPLSLKLHGVRSRRSRPRDEG